MKTVLLPAALLFAAVGGVHADPIWQDDVNWMKVMAFAAHQTDYSGTFVYQYGGHVEISRITHVADRDGEHGRLESLDGPRREVVRHNDQVWCYQGDHRIKVERRPGGREFPALLPEQFTLLKENYQVKPAEEVRLAGFHAHAMVFQPKDSLRYAHKMWADSASGLLLKSAVLDERGGVVEQYSFTQLSIGGDVDRNWIASSSSAADPTARDAAHKLQLAPETDSGLSKSAESPIVSGWRVDAMPEGFKKIAEVRRHLRGKDAPVIQMVFSDGLAGISIFIERLDGDEGDSPRLASRGAIQVYSKPVDDHLVTVVGEVPPGTVMQVADSVRYGASQ